MREQESRGFEPHEEACIQIACTGDVSNFLRRVSRYAQFCIHRRMKMRYVGMASAALVMAAGVIAPQQALASPRLPPPHPVPVAKVKTAAQGDAIVKSVVQKQLRDVPGGKKISDDTVAYDNGAVQVVVSGKPGKTARKSLAASRTHYIHGCPFSSKLGGAHWWCFYEGYQYNEREVGLRRIQFKECKKQEFRKYGFSDKASSWVNTSGRVIRVWNLTGVLWIHSPLWLEKVNGKSSFVGYAVDNKADGFDCVRG